MAFNDETDNYVDTMDRELLSRRAQNLLRALVTGETPPVRILALSAVPVVLLSAATAITATGALTGLTALPYTPSGVVRVYCFAQTGLTAGLYFARFSSTTACQLYTDAAGTITPTGITAGAYISGTSTVTLASTTVAGNGMGPNGVLRINRNTSISNTATNKVGSMTLGGQTIGAWGATTVNATTELRTVRNRNNPSLQHVASDGFGYGAFTTSVYQTTIDTSVDQVLAVRGSLGALTDFMILEGYSVELLA